MEEAERRSKFKSKRGLKSHLRLAADAKAAVEPAQRYWGEVYQNHNEDTAKWLAGLSASISRQAHA